MGLAFLRVAGLGDGDVEKERDLGATNTDVDPEPGSKPGPETFPKAHLERLPLKELCWEEWLE